MSYVYTTTYDTATYDASAYDIYSFQSSGALSFSGSAHSGSMDVPVQAVGFLNFEVVSVLATPNPIYLHIQAASAVGLAEYQSTGVLTSLNFLAFALGGVLGHPDTGSAILDINSLNTSYIAVVGIGSFANTGVIGRRNYSDYSFPTQIAAAVGMFDQSLKVQSTAGYPPVPFAVVVDRMLPTQETMLVTEILDNSHFSVTRAYNNGQLMIHDINAIVEHDTISLDFQEANEHHTDASRDDHTQYMKTDGTRHNLFDRHLIGQSLIAGMPSISKPGDVPSSGTSPLVADAKHVHGREAASDLVGHYMPVGMISLFPSVTTMPIQQSLPEILSSIAVVAPYGNPGVNNALQLPRLLASPGWLYCDGSSYTEAEYPLLYAALGGSGGTFKVPDLVAPVSATNTQGYLSTDRVIQVGGGYSTTSTIVTNPKYAIQQRVLSAWVKAVIAQMGLHPHSMYHGYPVSELDALRPYYGYFRVYKSIAHELPTMKRIQTYKGPQVGIPERDYSGLRFLIKADY